MKKKLTITVDERVYEGLYRVAGSRRISRFIEELVRPHVLPLELESAYARMAQDREREAAALDWSDALISDTYLPEQYHTDLIRCCGCRTARAMETH